MLEALLQLWPSSLTSQALLVGAVVGAAVYLLTKKRYRKPPHPPGWPIIGNLLDLNKKEKMFKLFHKWSKELGPIMTIKMASLELVLLSRIDLVLEALVKKQADFAGRPHLYSNDTMFENGSDIITANYGPRWKLHRKLVSKAIRHYISGGTMVKHLSKSISISTGLMLDNKEPFDPFPFINLTVFNILYSMCFNKFSSTVDDKMFNFYVGVLDTFGEEAGSGLIEDFIPPMRLCPTGKFKRMVKKFQSFNDAIGVEVAEHRQTYQPGVSRDFTDSLLLAQEEAKAEEDPVLLSQITDRHLVFTATDVFFAGIDTTRNTLHWVLLVMCLYPDVQRRVQEEVDAVVGSDLNMELSMRERLPYTEAVLYETMRIRPVAPLGVPRETMKETSVGGYELPKGTTMMVNFYALHFDPDQWDAPEEFRPERFLDASGKMAPKPESWLPFSAGRRVCLGEILARPEMHLIIAGIMRAVSVELAPGDTTDFEPLENRNVMNTPKIFKIVAKSRLGKSS